MSWGSIRAARGGRCRRWSGCVVSIERVNCYNFMTDSRPGLWSVIRAITVPPMTPTAAAVRPAGVPVVVAGVMSNNNPETENTMSTNTTTTKADQLAERAKRTEAKAAEAQARAEAQAAKAAKAQAAAEAEREKAAEREIAEAAKQAEADRIAQATGEAKDALYLLAGTESAGLVSTVKAAWHLGDVIVTADLKARPVAIAAMGDEAWQAAEAEAKANGKQAQPRYLSKVNDSINVRKQYATVDEAISAAGQWSIDNPESMSLRAFANGKAPKAKAKGDPMTAKAAARLFAQAVAREGLSDEQAMDLIAEAMASIAE